MLSAFRIDLHTCSIGLNVCLRYRYVYLSCMYFKIIDQMLMLFLSRNTVYSPAGTDNAVNSSDSLNYNFEVYGGSFKEFF